MTVATRAVTGVGGIVLFADHADQLAAWYRESFGLHFRREPGTHAWRCELDGIGFGIHQARTARGAARRQVEITWRVADLDLLVERLAEAGVAVAERQETPTGDYAWLDDPEGNRLELWHPPH